MCTLNPALAVSAALGSSPWILLAPPRQGRAQVSVPLHSQGLESHAVPPPQPSPGRALPPAAALNKPLSVLLITLGCSSGLAGAGGGCADCTGFGKTLRTLSSQKGSPLPSAIP